MKPYDILAIGELNVDLILNNIDGEPEVGKEKFAGDMILTEARLLFLPPMPPRWVQKWALWE